jgi:hypothetical protein
MSQLQIIRNAMVDAFSISDEDDGVRVTTHCLYPSNGLVQVIVRGGTNTFFVSDEGRAVQEIEAAGAEIHNVDRLVSHLVVPHGLSVSKGVIRSAQCDASNLPVSIAIVANISKSVADYLFSHVRVRPHKNFRSVVSSFVRAQYQTVHEEVIVGSSNKQHRFDNVIILSGGRKVVVDPVVPDHNSIASRVLANMDVRSAKYPDIEQRIVYDDADSWKSEDLNLLQAGADVISFSKASIVLKRLAKTG